MILEKQASVLQTELEEVEILTPMQELSTMTTTPEYFNLYNEVEKETVTGDKVIVKELVRTSTESEILADIANLRNEAQNKLNQALELENLINNK
jgi:hypothetical protein